MKTTLFRAVTTILAFTILFPPEFASAWGNDGHMLVNRVASEKVPRTMPLFFRQATLRLTYLGPEPDRWHSNTEMALRRAGDPDHYINLEMVAGMELPPDRYAFIAALQKKRAADEAAGIKPPGKEALTPDNVGMQPYIVAEVYDRLKVAFREYRRLRKERKPTLPAEQNAVFYAGWLGHYVADAANPLHDTIHYNGWVGDNPRGYSTARDTHHNFESAFVSANLKRLEIAGMVREPRRLEHPFQDYLRYIREGNALVERLYQLDQGGAFNAEGTPEGIEFVRARLAAGTQMLLNLWYTAWLESENTPPPYVPPAPDPARRARTPPQPKAGS